MSILSFVQATVLKSINIIAKVIKVDIEVVDTNLYRIAGTGKFAIKINQDMSLNGYVYKNILKIGETKVITDPGIDLYCKNCKNYKQCNETFEIATPIKMRDKVIGVIGLVSFNEKQKEVLESDLDLYVALIEQIADFIGSKAYEYLQKNNKDSSIENLEKIISKIDQCAIVVNKKDEIENINKNALNQLNLRKNILRNNIIIKKTGDEIQGKLEYSININGEKFNVIGELININDEKYNNILLFDNVVSNNLNVSKSENINKNIEIIGDSKLIKQLKKEIKMVSKSSSSILIRGDSGSGKSLVAYNIWNESHKSNSPLIVVDCNLVPEEYLEAELFGYVKNNGDSSKSRGQIGKLEMANKGTIFINGISELSLYLQSKLLRAIKENQINRIGSNRIIPIDVRIIAGTNKDIKALVDKNLFIKDLYYILNVIPMKIPPLRERKEDIEELVFYFIDYFCELFDKFFYKIEDDVIDILYSYSWPGNVRELKNTIEFMVNMMENDGILNINTIPQNILENEIIEKDITPIRELEKKEILKALNIYGYDFEGKKKAAEKLGLSMATLYRKLEKYGFSK